MSTSKENIKYHYLLFLLSPVIALIYGLRTKSKSYIRWTFFVFIVIYGSLLHPSFLGDGEVHWGRVYSHYVNLDFGVFWEELKAILSLAPTQNTNDDPYIHILSYFVGTLLNAPGLFFIAVAIVYGYFYSGAVVKLLSYVNWDSKYNRFYFFIFLAIFFLTISVGRMQTVRTWTGMWVLIYAIISYYETKKIKYLILSLLPVFIHVGYFLLGLPIWFVLFSGLRKPKIYFIIFMISVIASNVINESSALEVMSTTEVGASKAEAYYRDADESKLRKDNLEEKLKGQTFYRKFQKYKVHNYVFTGMIIFIFVVLRKRGFSTLENELFSYGLAMASFSNFMVFLFAVHNRGWGIAIELLSALIVIFLSNNEFKNLSFSFLKVKLPLTILTILIVPYLLLLLSQFIGFTSPYLFGMPFAMWINFDMGISIKGLIGIIL